MSEAPTPVYVADDFLPPQALDIEAAVVGSILTDPKYVLPVVTGLELEPEHFYHVPYRRLYAILTAMGRAGDKVTPRAVEERLRANGLLDICGGPAWLAQLTDMVDSTRAADQYAAIVMDRANRRLLVAKLREALPLAHDTDMALDYVTGVVGDALETVRTKAPGRNRRPALRCAVDIAARPIDWIWPWYLARGAITMLEGDPGRGKGFITIDLAARITQGDAMPDGTAGVHGTVLFLTGEDSPEYTERPRLEAAGADLRRVYFLPEKGQGQRWDLTADAETLEAYVRDAKADLLVIDPISEFLEGVDTNKDNEVRRVLAGLRDIAVHTGCSVLTVRHLNKGTGAAAIYRGGGSIAFTGAARFVFTVGQDPDDKTRRALATTKNNLTPHAPTLLYRITSCGPVGCVTWEGTSDLTADDVLQMPRERPKDAAEEFLREALAEGPVGQKTLEAQAKAAGISPRTLQRAKENLGVESKRTGTVWEWWLQDSQFAPKVANLASPESGNLDGAGPTGSKVANIASQESGNLGDEVATLPVPLEWQPCQFPGSGNLDSTAGPTGSTAFSAADADPGFDPFGDE